MICLLLDHDITFRFHFSNWTNGTCPSFKFCSCILAFLRSRKYFDPNLCFSLLQFLLCLYQDWWLLLRSLCVQRSHSVSHYCWAAGTALVYFHYALLSNSKLAMDHFSRCMVFLILNLHQDFTGGEKKKPIAIDMKQLYIVLVTVNFFNLVNAWKPMTVNLCQYCNT